ncbi:hypothetical protein D3C80_1831430 [compost metagenome]
MGRKAPPALSPLTQAIEQLVRRVPICWPPKTLLRIANGLASVGTDDAIGVARIMPVGVEQVLQLHALAAAQRQVFFGPAACDEAPARKTIA